MDANGTFDSNSSTVVVDFNTSTNNEKIFPSPFIEVKPNEGEIKEDLNLPSALNIDGNDSLMSESFESNNSQEEGFLNKFKRLIPGKQEL